MSCELPVSETAMLTADHESEYVLILLHGKGKVQRDYKVCVLFALRAMQENSKQSYKRRAGTAKQWNRSVRTLQNLSDSRKHVAKLSEVRNAMTATGEV